MTWIWYTHVKFAAFVLTDSQHHYICNCRFAKDNLYMICDVDSFPTISRHKCEKERQCTHNVKIVALSRNVFTPSAILTAWQSSKDIFPVGVTLTYVDGRAHRRSNMMKLTDTFRDNANDPKNTTAAILFSILQKYYLKKSAYLYSVINVVIHNFKALNRVSLMPRLPHKFACLPCCYWLPEVKKWVGVVYSDKGPYKVSSKLANMFNNSTGTCMQRGNFIILLPLKWANNEMWNVIKSGVQQKCTIVSAQHIEALAGWKRMSQTICK